MPKVAVATARLVNARGLHARPCHSLVSAALAHRALLKVRCGGHEVDGRSILSLMTLGAAHGAELEFEAEGEDADVLVRKLVEIVAGGFAEVD
jgi:phosphotransferase system HPr (HPr) family protein